jgi:hypothetical protein
VLAFIALHWFYVVKQNMAALLIKCKALSLQEKLNVTRKVEANPNVTQVQLAKELNILVTTLMASWQRKMCCSQEWGMYCRMLKDQEWGNITKLRKNC